MACSSMISPILPPGFRFHPTDEELIIHYLKKKLSSSANFIGSLIADVDIYKFNPWELPDKAFLGENEWFFFSPRDRKYPNGDHPNRAAASGYWKATGTDKPILTSRGSRCIGVKKPLIFYKGHPPKGTKTNWIMYVYRLLNHSSHSLRLRGSMRLDNWVLCRIRNKSGMTTTQYCKGNGSSLVDYAHINVGETENIEKISYLKEYETASKETEILDDSLQEKWGLSATFFCR